MACPEWKPRLMDWILEELPPAEAQEVERHVESCGDCGRSLAELRQAIHLLKESLPEREMPARLVFLEEKSRSHPVPFLVSLWRTAALAGLAAVIFLGIVLGGYSRWGNRPAAPVPVSSAGLTRPEVEALVKQGVAEGLEQQKQMLQEVSLQSAARFEKAQARNLRLVASKLDFLESAQNVVWKQTQEQGAMMEVIARSTLGGQGAPSRNP